MDHCHFGYIKKIDQKTIDSGRTEDMEMYPKLAYYEGEGKHEASAKRILMWYAKWCT